MSRHVHIGGARTPRLVCIPALILILGLVQNVVAAADRVIDETRKVDKDAIITVETIAGSVTVTGWNRGEVKITGTLGDEAEELRISGDSKQLAIKVQYPDRTGGIKHGSKLEIQVPTGSRLEISSVSADVSVDRTEGALEVKTVSGATSLRGKPASVRVETVSGMIDIDAATDRASVSCISGSITVAGVRRELTCNAVSGSIEIDAGKDLTSLKCEVLSGSIAVAGQLARKAEWDLSTHSGDVTVDLSGKVDARFRLKTFSGTIAEAFGHKAERTSKYAPGKQLIVTEGGGEALVKVDAFSGNIRVRRQ